MMSIWKNLQGRLILYFVLISTLPLSFVAILSYNRASHSLIRVERSHLNVLLDSKIEESDRMIRMFRGPEVEQGTLVTVLRPFVERIRVEPNGTALLLKSDGTVLTATAGSEAPASIQIPPGDLRHSVAGNYRWGNQRYFAVFRAYPDQELVLCVANREADFMREVHDLAWVMGIVGILCLVAAVGGGWLIARSLSRPVREVVRTAQTIARGDLRVQIQRSAGVAEMEALSSSLEEMNSQLREMILEVRESAGEVAKLAARIHEDSRQAAGAAREQTAEVERVAVAVAQARAASNQSCDSSLRTAELARNSAEAAQRGHDAVTDTIRGIGRVDDVVSECASIIRSLGTNSTEIGEVIMVIDEIADQTNLLALNAAIEAARADEHGRGFAVVADEVRKLAERTSLATREIARTVKSIQDGAGRAVSAMEQGTQEVRQGRELADRAGLSLREILAMSHQMLGMMQENNRAATDQAHAAEEISDKMQRISAAISETDRRFAGVAGAATQLNQETEELSQLVSAFRLEEESTEATPQEWGQVRAA